MAKRKTLAQRVAALERKVKSKGTREKSGKKTGGKKRKVSGKASSALEKVNSYAKTIRRQNPSWRNSRVMKAAGKKYKKCGS